MIIIVLKRARSHEVAWQASARGFTNYEARWRRHGRDQPTGRVEVDEMYPGGEEAGIRRRGARKKALIVVAVESVRRRIGWPRAKSQELRWQGVRLSWKIVPAVTEF